MSFVGDGFYYTDEKGKTHGPLDKIEWEAAQARGLLKPGTKAWRQKAGSYYTVHIKRNYIVGRVFSLPSCGYCMEFLGMSLSFIVLCYCVRAPKMQAELHPKGGGDNYFLEILLLLTFAMVILTIAVNLGRARNHVSAVKADESPV